MGRRVVELFAGVGGFRLGLQHGGWQVVWSNQWEPGKTRQWASECYVHRFGQRGHLCEDIARVPSTAVPDHDLLVAGFPCQDYSVAATLDKSGGITGKKGVLWWEIARIVRAKEPRFLLLENVDRLLRSPARQRGRDFGVMLHCLAELGYTVEWRVLNAADYGAPQRRRRVFIFAARSNTRWGKATAVGAASGRWLHRDGFFAREFRLLDNTITLPGVAPPSTRLPQDLVKLSDHFEFHFQNAGVMVARDVWTSPVAARREALATLGDFLEHDPGPEYYISRSSLPRWEAAKDAKSIERVARNGHRYRYSEGKMSFPDSHDRPARTILTGEGGKTPGRSRHIVTDPKTGRHRILTPGEVERLNGFEPGWTDTGMPKSWRYYCMGNALVVDLVRRMAPNIALPGPNRKAATETPILLVGARRAAVAANASGSNA